jgi:hypothetical protein
MAIIKQFDKRSGITYAYESHSYWDKEKKTSRAKRKLIGRVDPITGEINPTDGRCKRDKVKNIKAQNPDYKKLYEGLQKKYIAMETLHVALQREIKELKEKARYV